MNAISLIFYEENNGKVLKNLSKISSNMGMSKASTKFQNLVLIKIKF